MRTISRYQTPALQFEPEVLAEPATLIQIAVPANSVPHTTRLRPANLFRFPVFDLPSQYSPAV